MDQQNQSVSDQEQNKTRQKGYYNQRLKILANQDGLSNKIIEKIRKKITKQPKENSGKKLSKDSAAQARKIKALYIQALQELSESRKKLLQDNKSLRKVKEDLQQAIQNSKNQYKRINLNTAQKISNSEKKHSQNTFKDLQDQMHKLYTALKQNSQLNISRSLSYLRDKYGISGRQRFKQIESLFDRIIQILMPMHFRVLIEYSEDSKNFYRHLCGVRTLQSPKFSQEQKNALIRMRPQFVTHKKEYTKILEQLNSLKHNIKHQSWLCQGVIDNIQESLEPSFVANLLINLDYSRQKQGLHAIYPCNYWKQLKKKHTNQFYQLNDTDRNFNEPGHNILNNESQMYYSDNALFNELFM